MMQRQASIQRVVNRYLTKVAKEKSLNQKIDEAFRGWKGKNPVTKNDVSYWTVKGWRQLSDKAIKEDKDKDRLKEYAEEVFKSFEDHIKGDMPKSKKKNKKLTSQEAQLKEIQKSIKDMVSRPNFGLPENVFKDNKLGLTIDAPSKEDVIKLSQDIKEMFKTPGFQRSAIAQNMTAFVIDEFSKRTLKMLSLPIEMLVGKVADLGSILGSESAKSLSESMKETRESNPEVRRMQQNLAIYWTQSTFAVSAQFISMGVTAKLGTAISASLGLGTSAVAGVAVAPTVCTLAVGAILYKTLLHSRTNFIGEGKSKLKSWFRKKTGLGDDLPDSYDNLAADIYTGYATPEGVEQEYTKKLEAILNDPSLDPLEARKKIIELYEDFDKNARPSIDKGLFLLGLADKGEGAGSSDIVQLFSDTGFSAKDPSTWSSALSKVANKIKKLNRDDLAFMRMGGLDDLSFLKIYETHPNSIRTANKEKPPVLQQIMQYKDMFDAQEQIIAFIEESPEEFGKEIQRVMGGESEIPSPVQDYYKGDFSKEYDSEDTSSKKARMARRIARHYMIERNR
jgi:hypothetical protein